ncbi:MAG: BatD family protein [Spongiibacteraceae bacterium]|nr:BatD family protein [Spongiibacteraceae bacterium]
MNKAHRPFLYCLLFFLVFLASSITQAATIEQLINDNKLTVEIRQKTQGVIIAKQPVVFDIEVSTLRWFAKGTGVKPPAITNVLVLPMSVLGMNSTKKIAGKTWVTQTRELTLYPLKAGRYHLPALVISISVNSEAGIVEGKVFTQALQFTAEIPLALEHIKDYIASPDVVLDIEEKPEGKDSYAIGEAITRTISLIATDVPGMMLPVADSQNITGLSVYQKPPQLYDTTTRGLLTGKRVESLTYIFEQAGDYQLPEQTFYWWNTQSKVLSELVIPARGYSVSGSSWGRGLIGTSDGFFYPLILVLFTGAVLVLVFTCYRFRRLLLASYARFSHLEIRKQRYGFLRAISRCEYALAIQLLYQISCESHQQNRRCPLSLKQLYEHDSKHYQWLTQMQKKAYGKPCDDLHINRQSAKSLLKAMGTCASQRTPWAGNHCLEINP